uniref:Uncharacterized protein n=1 Tax=Anguilla anguilla TaxID=7936 RepID=A0A0E9W512_ANGAN
MTEEKCTYIRYDQSYIFTWSRVSMTLVMNLVTRHLIDQFKHLIAW